MDTETVIETAKAPGVFDVLSFVEETAYPTETVVVFQNVKGAAEYVKLVAERTALETNKGKKADIEALTEKIEKLGEEISASSIIFDLQGMPPGIVQDLIKQDEDASEGDLTSDDELIAKTIKAVRNANGDTDPRVWTGDDVRKLRAHLKEGEFGKLVRGVGAVNFNAMVFDQATDAGFSGRRADVA